MENESGINIIHEEVTNMKVTEDVCKHLKVIEELLQKQADNQCGKLVSLSSKLQVQADKINEYCLTINHFFKKDRRTK